MRRKMSFVCPMYGDGVDYLCCLYPAVDTYTPMYCSSVVLGWVLKGTGRACIYSIKAYASWSTLTTCL